jgi:tetratricopeptide (TPR) repeat protein
VVGQFLGSLHYASPEQCQGEEVSPASDLYALGVLLYELSTGLNPFRHDQASAAIAAHLQKVPTPVAEIDPDITLFFSEVIATLMAKSPGDRLASAAELASVLAEGEDGDWWLRRREQIHAPERPGISIRRETSLRGRDTELEELEHLWRGVCQGHGAAVLLQGEAGLGKTRLVDAFLSNREPEETHLLYGSFPPAGGLRGLTDAVRGKLGARDLEGALQPYLPAMPGLLPAFAALLRGLPPPSGAALPRGDALSALFCHLLQALAEERPTIWVLDDLHFAPGQARAIALAMARTLSDRKAMLIVTSRPNLPDSQVAHFSRLEHARRMRLNRLSPREVMELLRELLGSGKLVDALGAKVAYKSDGVPFFIFEMIRELAEKRLLERGPDGAYIQTREIEDIEVPSAVRDLISGRLAELSREERSLIDVGAVQGHEFDAELTSSVVERPVVRILQDLAEIERHHGIVRSAGRRYRFDHHQIQEVVYRDLAPRLREEYHALLADAFLKGVPEPNGADAHFAAYHHLRGSRPADALPHVRAALIHLEQRWLNEEALDLAERALPHAEGERRLSLLMRKIARLDILGRREAQGKATEEALALADELGDPLGRARALHAIGMMHWGKGDWETAMGVFERELGLAREAGDREQEGTALVSIGVVLDQTGRKEEAIRTFRDSMRLAQEIGDARQECAARANLALGLAGSGRYQEALDEYEVSLRIGREIGDIRVQVYTQGSIGTALWHLGRFSEAKAHHEEHLTGSRQIGDRRGEAIASGNLGLALQHLGSLAEAREHITEQLEIAVEIGAGHIEAISKMNLGALECHLGRLEEGRRMIDEGKVLAGKLSMVRNEALGLLSEASYTEDPESASRAANDALKALREIGDRGGESRALLSIGVWAARRGDEGEAIEALDKAAEIAREVSQLQVEVICLAYRATLPGGDAEAARGALAEQGANASSLERLEARFRLWQATGGREELEPIHRLLMQLRDAAPEDCRTSILEEVPLHREIVAAWAEQRGE